VSNRLHKERSSSLEPSHPTKPVRPTSEHSHALHSRRRWDDGWPGSHSARRCRTGEGGAVEKPGSGARHCSASVRLCALFAHAPFLFLPRALV
jgi:hypothetical protein